MIRQTFIPADKTAFDAFRFNTLLPFVQNFANHNRQTEQKAKQSA